MLREFFGVKSISFPGKFSLSLVFFVVVVLLGVVLLVVVFLAFTSIFRLGLDIVLVTGAFVVTVIGLLLMLEKMCAFPEYKNGEYHCISALEPFFSRPFTFPHVRKSV